MARSRSSSSLLRYLNAAYYLSRPKRFAAVFIVLLLATVVVWDRRYLVREQEEEISMLSEELVRLQTQLQELETSLADGGGGRSNSSVQFAQKSSLDIDPVNIERREKVKEAMLHAWKSYEMYAWGQDELSHKQRMVLTILVVSGNTRGLS